MINWFSRNWRWAGPTAIAGLAAAYWLLIVFFGVHTLFIDDKVNEDGPVFASGAGASAAEPEQATDDQSAQTEEAVEDSETSTEVMDEEEALNEGVTDEEATDTGVIVEATGSFIDRAHPATGVAEVLSDGTGQRFLRFEDFEVDNGPDLFVYLSTASPDAPEGEFDDDFVDLGTLKGNIGAQNYEIPEDVDIERYTTVVIWCKRFTVAFAAAGLAA